MKLSFIYFDAPFWRAEVGRIALYIGGIDFEDLRITREEFLRAQETGHLDNGIIIPFHQFPCLLIDGISIAQTAGIARFCGKLSGLYPTDNDINSAKIDQFLDIATDINVLIATTGSEPDEKTRRIKRQELAAGELPRKLGMLDRSIAEDSDWIVKPTLTIADIAIWRLMGWLSSGMVDGIPIDLLRGFSKIQRVCVAVDSYPKVQEWIAVTYPKDYQRGNYL